MAELKLEISGGIGGGDNQVLQAIEATLRRIAELIERQQAFATRALGIQQNTQNVINRTTQIYQQQNVQLTQVQQNLTIINRITQENERRTAAWAKAMMAVASGWSSFNQGYGRGGGLLSSVSGRVSQIGRESFNGLFGGQGLGGVVGGLVRTPFAIAEFGTKLGGDLAKNLAHGFTHVMGSIGQGLSSTVVGAVLGIPMQAIGSSVGALGSIGGLALEAAGGVLGKVGEIGGKIAERLVNGVTKGLAVAGTATAGFAIAAVNQAGESERLRGAFEGIAGRLGNPEQMLERLKAVTRGTLSERQLMLQANRAVQLGAVDTSKQLEYITNAAVRLGRAVGRDTTDALDDMVAGLGRMSPRLLDNLGIMVRIEEANERYAMAVGKSTDKLNDQEKRTAFLITAMNAIDKKIQATGPLQADFKEGWEQLTVSIIDTTDAIGRTLLPTATKLLGIINPYVDRLRDWVNENEKLISERVQKFFESLPGWLTKAWDAVKGLAKGTADFLGLDWNNAIEKAKAFMGSVTGGLKDLPKTLDDTFATLADSKGVTRFLNRLSDSIANSISAGVQKAKIEHIYAPVLNGSAPIERQASKMSAGVRNATKAPQAIGQFFLPDFFNFANAPEFESSPYLGYGRSFHRGIGGPQDPPSLSEVRPSIPRRDTPINPRIAKGLGGAVAATGATFSPNTDAQLKFLEGVLRRMVQTLDRHNDDLAEARSRYADLFRADVATRVRWQTEIAAITAEFGERRAAIRAEAAQRQRALPGQVADRFSGDIGLPGVSLHARAAFARKDRAERRERVADINQSFGSRGVDSGLGAPAAGLFGTGFGGGRRGAADDAQRELLAAVVRSAAFAEESAQIEREKSQALKAAKDDENAAIRELVTSSAKSQDELRALMKINTEVVQKQVSTTDAFTKDIAQIKKEMHDLRRLAVRN